VLSRSASADLFGATEAEPPRLAGVPDRVAGGLAQLEAAPPARWPLDQAARWPAMIDRVTAFASQWDGAARACGWDDVSLYGLHCRAPWARLSAMGAAFVIALEHRPPPLLVARKGPVAAVTAEAIVLITPTSSRLRLYRRPLDREAVAAWSLA
jgi:hypothetical protein